MLGHSMGTLCTFVRTSVQRAEAFRGSGDCSPRKVLNFTASHVGSEAIPWCIISHGKLVYDERSARFAFNNDTTSADNLIAYLHALVGHSL